MTITIRTRSLIWFAVGAIAAVVATAVWISAWSAEASPGDTDATVVPITACRLTDTRPNTTVGPRSTPLGAEETYVVDVQNASTNCVGTVPGSATGLLLNVTAVQPTQPTFLSVWDTGPFPGTSSLNPVPGPPVPNAVTTKLADDDTFRVYNRAGTTHVIIDIVGYLTPVSLQELAANAGTPGPKGDPGVQGPAGPQGPAGSANTGHSTATLAGTVGGGWSSTAIATNGNPIISYANASMAVAACDDPTCTNATITEVDTAADAFQYTSIAIGADGNPIISYYGFFAGLKVAACTNPTCTGEPVATTTALDNGGDLGGYTSIAIGTNGNPIISYYDDNNDDLKVAACTNPTCTAANITPLDTGGVGRYTSIAIGANGNPIISYYDNTNDDLKVAACTNPTCTAATITPLDTIGKVGGFTSITIGADGNPIISYYDDTNIDLKVAACTNPTCTAATITPLDTDGDVGGYTSVVVGTDGNPIISYYDYSNGRIKVAVCGNPTCAPYPGRSR